ncbi:MAG: hypothetical protein AAGG68_27550 [Bacteroidota bacterium]
MKKLPIFLDANLSIESEQGGICQISSDTPNELLIRFDTAKTFKYFTKSLPIKPWSLLKGKNSVNQFLDTTQLHLKVAVQEQILASKNPSEGWQFNSFRLIRLYLFS